MTRTGWTFVVLNTLGGIGHHVDHTLRHNVGWPLNQHVNGYTITLLIYVVILIGVVYTRRGVLGTGFWLVMCIGGFVYTAGVHFLPGSPDPPAHYAALYGSGVYGALAVAWLLLFLLSLAVSGVYFARLWLDERQAARVTAVAQ